MKKSLSLLLALLLTACGPSDTPSKPACPPWMNWLPIRYG